MLKLSPVRTTIRTVRFMDQKAKCIAIGYEKAIHSLSCRKIRKRQPWLKIWKDSMDLPTIHRDRVQMLFIMMMKRIAFSGTVGLFLFNQGACKGLGRRLMWLGLYFQEKSIERREKRYKSIQVHEHRVLQKMTDRLIGPDGQNDLSTEDNRIRDILNMVKK